MPEEQESVLLFHRGEWRDIPDPLAEPTDDEFEAANQDAKWAMASANGYSTTWTEFGLGDATFPIEASLLVRIYSPSAGTKSPPYPYLVEVEHGVVQQRIFCTDWLSMFQLMRQLTPIVNCHLATVLARQRDERGQSKNGAMK